MAAKQEVQVIITGKAGELYKTLGEASKATERMAKEMEAAVGGVKNLLEGFLAPLALLSAALGGGEFLKGTVEESKNWTVEAQKLARILGITTEQASALNLAIGDIYGTQEEYLGAVAKLTKTLNSNEESFRRLGVATRDSAGRLRDTPSIMAEVNQKLAEMKSGTDRNVASAQIYGKSWMEVQRYLKLTPEVLQAAQEKAERLNLIVGGDSVAATDAYRASMNDLDDMVKGLKLRIGRELMPVMTEWNALLADEGPAAVSFMTGFVKGFKLTCLELSKVVSDISAEWDNTVRTLATGAEFASKAMASIAARDLKGLRRAWGDFRSDMEMNGALLRAELEANDLLINQMKSKFDGGGDGNSGPQLPKKARGMAAPGGDSETALAKLKAQLEEKKFLYEMDAMARGQFLEFSKEQEAEFWRTSLNAAGLNAKEKHQVEKFYYEATRASLMQKHKAEMAELEQSLEAYKHSAQQRMQIAIEMEDRAGSPEELQKARALQAKIRADILEDANKAALVDLEASREHAQALIELDIDRLNTLKANGAINDQQHLDAMKRLEAQKYQIALKGLEDRLFLLAIQGNREKEAAAKVEAEIQALKDKHASANQGFGGAQAQIDTKTTFAGGATSYVREAQQSLAEWGTLAKNVIGGVENAFASGIQGILSGQMSLGQGMKAIWQGIVGTVTQAVAQLVAKWIVMTVVKKALGIDEAATDGARTTAALVTASAETWAAYAGIPFAGPILAEAQIALMYTSMGLSALAAEAIGSEITARSVGGRVDKPEFTWLGEKGPEIVAPESDFQDYTRNILRLGANLGANLGAADAQVANYERLSSRFVESAADQRRAAGPAPAQSGPHELHLHMPGMVNLDSSERGTRNLGALVMDGAIAKAREMGVVLKPGHVFGGI